MCGICGYVRADRGVDAGAVGRMRGALAHRGPDGQGRFVGEQVTLEVCRLSIIDVNGGHQPLYNEDGSVVLVMNGELYNFVELRHDLVARGHRFATRVDGEVVVHLYEELGLDCVRPLRGMFAFALWDRRAGRLVLARDRMGEKPLYLYERDQQVLFASEIKALLSSGLVPFELDPVSVDLYLHYQNVPEPRTALRGVRKLPPGHMLLIEPDPWRVDEICYWRLEDSPVVEGDPGELLLNELEAVSEIILRSDVPLGVALSGGLDSSSIAALLAKECPGELHVFSVGYEGRPGNDERDDAKALAEHLGLWFHEVELGVAEVVESFPALVLSFDDPIADMAGFGYRAIMRLARSRDVPVIFQGQGGDELFWGYPYLRQAVEASLERLAPGLDLGAVPVATVPGRTILYDLVPEFQLARERVGELYRPEFAAALAAYPGPGSLFPVAGPADRLDLKITKGIIDLYLLENGIAQGDRLSMASSVELRLPLVDYRFVETVVGLRKGQVDYLLPPKAWLRQAASRILPDWVLDRPKRPFRTPYLSWSLALLGRYGPYLDDGYLVQTGVLRGESMREMRRWHHPTAVSASLPFKLLVLELWCRLMSTLPAG